MAEENEQQDQQENIEEVSKKGSKLPWIIMAIIVPIGLGGGLGLGYLMAGSKAKVQEQQQDTEEDGASAYDDLLAKEGSDNNWFHTLEPPIVVNLNEPGATRYIRVAFTLELSGTLDQEKGKQLFAEKSPLIKNWLTIYLADKSLASFQGKENLSRILVEIKDLLNAKLFPDLKPLIMDVLFDQSAIQ